MTVQLPNFNLGNSTLSDSEFESATNEGSRGFQPGNYTVTLRDVQYHKNRDTGLVTCKSDPTWVNVSMKMVGADGREKMHFIQVPFQSHLYTGSSGKKTNFPFRKLVEFMAGVGETVNGNNFGEIIQRYFGNEGALAQLEGQELNIDIGYQGGYVKFVEQGKFRIVLNGAEYSEGDKVLEFPDADSAETYALTNLGKRLQRFPEVLKVYPPQVGVKQTANEGW